MEHHAPREVIRGLSQKAYKCLSLRIKDKHLSPYIEPTEGIRIRGLKQSILYVSYSLRHDNRLEQVYESSAEEKEADRVMKIYEQILNLPQDELMIRKEAEAPYIRWEDLFQNFRPEFIPITPYRDIQQNTYAHIVALACNARNVPSLNEFYAKFREMRFETNPIFQTTNLYGQTPFEILLQKQEHTELVESLLLQIRPANRIPSLPLQFWNCSWGELNRDMIENNFELFLSQTRHTPNFLPIYIQLTYKSEDAIKRLFNSTYRIRPHHIKTNIPKNDLYFIGGAILNSPNWHNCTLLISLIKAQYPNLKDYVELLIARNTLIREELAAIAMNPDRIANYYAQGIKPGTLYDII